MGVMKEVLKMSTLSKSSRGKERIKLLSLVADRGEVLGLLAPEFSLSSPRCWCRLAYYCNETDQMLLISGKSKWRKKYRWQISN